MSKEKANQFLKDKGLIKNGYSEFVITQSDGTKIYLGELMSEYAEHLNQPKQTVSDEELKILIWEEWEGEIKENDPREMVFKYMKWMRDKLTQTNESELMKFIAEEYDIDEDSLTKDVELFKTHQQNKV